MQGQSGRQADIPTKADVVVLGSGAAGLLAAVEAADNGAETVVLEREAGVGGSTVLSAGYVAFCETDLQPGTRDELLEDLVGSHDHDADPGLSELYVDQAPSMYDRLGGLGIRFTGTYQFAHMSKPWAHELPLGDLGGGAQIVDKLLAAAVQRGVRVAVSAPAKRLLRETTGRVAGVQFQRDGSVDTVGAKAVVLATGGFTRNPDLIKHFGRPGAQQIVPITGPGSCGEGLVMGMALGAATSYLSPGIAPTGPVEVSTGKGCLVNYFGGILVNKLGHRFCNESGSYLDLSWAGLEQPDALMVHVFDGQILKDYMSSMQGRVLSGWKAYQADTLREALGAAAAECGLDVNAAEGAVMEYNQAVDVGRDPTFGRANLVGSSGDLVKIASPPFIVVVGAPGTTHFNGGLKIDDQMRVIDLFGEPISGLFGAGEVTGGFHGMGYLSATHLGSALIFGHRAGRNAAGAR